MKAVNNIIVVKKQTKLLIVTVLIAQMHAQF